MPTAPFKLAFEIALEFHQSFTSDHVTAAGKHLKTEEKNNKKAPNPKLLQRIFLNYFLNTAEET